MIRRLRYILLLLLSIVPLAVIWNYFHSLDRETDGLVSTLLKFGFFLTLMCGGLLIFARAVRNRSHAGRDAHEDNKED